MSESPAANPARMLLIDGSNQAFRAFFAIQGDMRGTDGSPTKALFGFSSMLDRLMKSYRPTYVAVLFDRGQSFRNALYPDYKGQRPDMPEDLRSQWPDFIPFCEELGMTALAIDGWEADDLIGTLATRLAGPEVEAWIVSSDKDFAQLVGPHIKLFDVGKDQVLGAAEVEEKWGVPPAKIIDLLALMGDSSDNIPGVVGVGPKKAAKYLQTYASVHDVIAAADQIGGKTGLAIAAHAPMVDLSYQLATIHVDCPDLSLTLADLKPREPNWVALEARLKRYNFKRMLAWVQEQLGDAATVRAGVDRSRYRCVQDAAALAGLVADLRRAGRFAYDCETTSLDERVAELVGMSFCWDPDFAVYVPISHEGEGNCPGALHALLPLLADPTLHKIGQNLKYDYKVLRARGHDLQGIVGDTMLADYLLNVDRKHGLDELALRLLDHRMISYKDLTADVDGQFRRVPVDKATEYAAEDAHVAWLIDRELDLAPVERVYRDIELPLVPILGRMELWGIRVDGAQLADLSVELGARMDSMNHQILAEAGEEFNINSTQQLAAILFEKRGLTPVKKTKTGFSTAADVLEKLAADGDRLCALILEYRELHKLKSTYVDALPQHIDENGRIHTSFHQAVAATGRLSSNDPNLQNIPIRSAEGRRIRACFVPEPGHRFLSADYSQVELRVLAHFCKEGPLVEAFQTGQDIHRRTAAEIFGVALPLVSADQRRAAKTINFGIIYGMSAFRLSNELGIPGRVAKQYIEDYFARYPQVQAFVDGAVASAKDKGYAETLFGRRRPVSGLDARNPNERGAAERIAVNTPVQGTAADLIKLAMIRVDRRLSAEFPDARLLLQVHDELVFEVPEGRLEALRAAVVEEMEGVAELIVPLKVDTGDGATWDAAH